MSTIIGIDLGTTNSVVAFMERGEPRVIINEEGGRTTPSVVGFAANGDRFVGEVAKRQLLVNPEATVYAIKRFMGRRYRDSRADFGLVGYPIVEDPSNGECTVPIGGRNYSPRELSAMILQKLKKAAEDFLGESVTEAVITVPAYFTDSQRQATRDAGTIAGLDVLRIINEPTAAALAYVHERKRPSTLAIYDFGGGTFDISVLQVAEDVAEVKATRGNNSLGGADIDRLLVQWLAEEFQKEHGTPLPRDKVVLQRLRDTAERAKHDLSTSLSTDIHLPFLVADHAGPKHLQTTLTRPVFEDLISPLVEQTLEECRLVLQDSGLNATNIDEVVLVGGSSRIPMVQERVKTLFGRPLNKGFNPDEVVAIGAAVQAGILEGDVKGVTLLDVTNFSLGIEVAGGRFAPLIPKNTTIPAQKSQTVSTVVDNQRTVKIHVLQGESKKARENVSLGEFELTHIQPAARGIPRIEVLFQIDASGIVEVTAQDTRTGLREKIKIDAPSGMNRKQLEALREEHAAAPQARDGDALKGLRSTIEEQIVNLESLLQRHQHALHKNEVMGLEQALKRGRMALLKSADKSNLTELSAYLRRFETHISGKLGGVSPA
jgi:molecular chaperone DnaK